MQEPDRLETSLDWALRYWTLGWNPLAAPPGEKRPLGQWKRWQQERMTETEVRRQFSTESENIWIACGRISNLVVLDCDTVEGEAYWATRIDLLKTACVKTAKGYHFYFRETKEVGSWSGDGFDVRAEGAGVISPPSIHANQIRYEWIRGPENIVQLPDALKSGRDAARRPRERTKDDGTTDALEHLLKNKPEEGERNVWLARVAGMYALRTVDWLTFQVAVTAAAADLGLEEQEVSKLIKSIWDAERSKTEDGQLPDRKSGFLCSAGEAGTYCLTSTKGGMGVDLWMDADIKAMGVTKIEDSGSRVFDTLIRIEGSEQETQLSTETLADGRKLLAWMTGLGIHQMNPPGAPKLGIGTMLCAYLDSQEPPAFIAVGRLGWHEASGSYVTNEGRITAQGLMDYEGVKPSLEVRRATRHYRYGQSGTDSAKAALAEVLTFHEESAVAVIASWWCAHFLKAQLMQRFKLFPICEVTAASESGKTTGFIPLLTRLGGAYGAGMGEVTRAGFRDALAPHEGIVRVDDKGDLDPIKDLLRSAPMGGVSTKKSGPGWDKQVEIEAHAAILITGQGLGIGKEKAIADRVVAVELGNPSKRMSLRDASKPQLVDVVAMERRLEAGAGFGGDFVQMALAWWEVNGEEFSIGTGRMANKHAIMRVGASLLRQWGGEDKWYNIVETQLRAEADQDTNEDELTITILPYILGKIGLLEHPKVGRFDYDPSTPVFVDKGTVWFNPEDVASWLAQDKKGRVDQRLHTREGIEQQAKALGLGGPVDKNGGRWQFKIRSLDGSATNRKRMYWSAWKYSETILERVEGSNGGLV